ncbi:MAG: DoxX family protein [Myxococcales bacterium]|nr:DoxX family protein [Myxococcales bacterium]MCB9582155.1 DoxX family protein [Polyangiaceae bacterium]
MSWPKTLAKTSPRQADLALLVLRLWFGTVLALGHGMGKILNLGAFIDNVAKRVPLPEVLGPAAALSEFAGGLLLALGLFTRPAAAMIVITMGVAAIHIHAADPFMKKEFALAYGFAALAVLIAGPGRYSLDARLFGAKR